MINNTVTWLVFLKSLEADHSQLFHRVDRILPKNESFQSSDSTAVTDIQRFVPLIGF